MEKQSSRLPAHDVYQLATLAASFEQIANMRMLSVYETEDQRSESLRSRLFGKGHGKVSENFSFNLKVSE